MMLQNHAWVKKDPFKVQDAPMDYNVSIKISFMWFQIPYYKYPLRSYRLPNFCVVSNENIDNFFEILLPFPAICMKQNCFHLFQQNTS